jgi:putative Holliday junction resolvase
MIIMSVDYGDARTGIAVCDRLEAFAHPVEVINQSYEPKVIKRIAELAEQYKVEMLVVGLPKNMDSTEGERAKKCIDFAEKLESETGIKTVNRDERLTTVSAYTYLNQTNTRGEKRKKIVDAVAAVIILQDYLDYRRLHNDKK